MIKKSILTEAEQKELKYLTFVSNNGRLSRMADIQRLIELRVAIKDGSPVHDNGSGKGKVSKKNERS